MWENEPLVHERLLLFPGVPRSAKDRQAEGASANLPRAGLPERYASSSPDLRTDQRVGGLDPEGYPKWTLDTLTTAAQQRGIQVVRSQVRRIFQQEGVLWRRTRLWVTSKYPDFAPKGRRSSRSTPPPQEAAVVCVDELGP